jgi:hypothetical protein
LEKAETPYNLINNKVIMPGEEELAKNPRSRSAKLRIAERKMTEEINEIETEVPITEEKQKALEEKEADAIKAVIKERAREDEVSSPTNISLRKIIGGDFLTAQMIRSQIG